MRQFSLPINDRKVRFALAGCGRIAKNHFAALREHHERAELVGVCDVVPEVLDAAAKETGAHPYGSLTDMLAESDADIVVLTTPSGLHPEQAMQVAASRRHVMTEKPMATRWHDGVQMVKACDEAGCPVIRCQAEPEKCHTAVSAKRNRKGAFWQDLHGQYQCVLDAPPSLL